MAARRADVVTIITSRRDMGHFRSQRIAAMENWSNKFCRKVVCVSEAVRDRTILDEKVNPRKVEVVYGGIDADYFSPPKMQKKDIKTFRVGMVATMDRELKGHLDFLKSAKIILEKRKDVQFILIGDGKLKASLVEFVQNNEMEEHVVFKGQHKDVRNEIATFDVFVLPSHTEGFFKRNLRGHGDG